MAYTKCMKRKILTIFCISLVILFLFAFFVNVIVFPKKYKSFVSSLADEYGLEIALVYAVIKAESDFDKNAVSKSGALGLMQILPSTAKWIAGELKEDFDKENLFEPQTNIKYGCFYLKYLFDKFGDREVVICAYNAGEKKVLDWLDDGKLNKDKIDYAETKIYLKRVNKFYRVYCNKFIIL